VQESSEAVDLGRILARAKARVFPALVFVSPVVEQFREGERKRQEVVGSGVIISPDGEAVTNRHVVDKAVEIRCLLHDGRVLKAKVIGQDKDTDLALIKLGAPGDGSDASARTVTPSPGITTVEPETVDLASGLAHVKTMRGATVRVRPAAPADAGPDADGAPAPVFPYAVFADSSRVYEGQFVMAMGAPWGLSRSVSLGIVSCTERFLPGTGAYNLWLQTDAALNPGNSGGPLVDTDGRVVGINTLANRIGGDMGFAVPSNTVRKVVDAIRRDGKVKRAFAGVLLQPLKDFKRNTFFDAENGVLIAGVAPGSPAAKTGLKAGDLLLSIAGRATDGITEEDLPGIRTTLAGLTIGEAVPLAVVRSGKRLALTLTPREKGSVEGEDFDCKKWNMTVKAINEFATPQLHYYVKEGVYIQGIRSPGNAAQAGLRRGDVIVGINDKPVKSLKALSEIYEEIVADESAPKRVRMEILRSALPKQVLLDYSTKYERE
jgi:serine protease Do